VLPDGSLSSKDVQGNWWHKGTRDVWWARDCDGGILCKDARGHMWKRDIAGHTWFHSPTAEERWQPSALPLFPPGVDANATVEADVQRARPTVYAVMAHAKVLDDKATAPTLAPASVAPVPAATSALARKVDIYGNTFTLPEPLSVDNGYVLSLFADDASREKGDMPAGSAGNKNYTLPAATSRTRMPQPLH
jgi:hypothetical protein